MRETVLASSESSRDAHRELYRFAEDAYIVVSGSLLDTINLFPWLYYGKRFDVLRKICFAAKTNAERHVRNREMRVHCHLSSADTNRIVASSL